jgi:hypothetical protein
LLNIALFDATAQQWRDESSTLKGYMRDHTNMHQLVCLANLESMNAYYIAEDVIQSIRLQKLNTLAVSQMTILLRISIVKSLV